MQRRNSPKISGSVKYSLSPCPENGLQPDGYVWLSLTQLEIPMNKTLIALLAAASVFAFGSAQAADAAKPADKAAPAAAAPAADAKKDEAKPAKKAKKAKKDEAKKDEAAKPAEPAKK